MIHSSGTQNVFSLPNVIEMRNKNFNIQAFIYAYPKADNVNNNV